MTFSLADSEILLCDTSFVAHSRRRATSPEKYTHWPPAIRARIDKAILAISVITIAEVRYGIKKGGWGEKRSQEEEGRVAAFLQVPLDPKVLTEWADLRCLTEGAGVALCQNDLWIAATAKVMDYALVTCDKDLMRIGDLGCLREVIYLPPEPVVPPSTR